MRDAQRLAIGAAALIVGILVLRHNKAVGDEQYRYFPMIKPGRNGRYAPITAVGAFFVLWGAIVGTMGLVGLL